MKIITYNVNGIRAAITKGLLNWVQATNPDVLCLQEIKATTEQIDQVSFKELGYTTFAFPAQKKGYSGVAIFTKETPKHVEFGCGIEKYDVEGRVIRADYADFSVMNVYMPSGSSGEERQTFKFGWMDDFLVYVTELQKSIPNLIVCGDFNICHQPIDIHNPKSNANTSGFLPEERAWMTKLFDSGFIDGLRHFNNEPHQYTWWSYRAGSRGKNLGWRIDYHIITKNMESRLKRSVILPDAIHSDHCPVLLEIIA